MTELGKCARSEPLHILAEGVVRERFEYDDAPGVHVAFVRVFALDPIWRFHGCQKRLAVAAVGWSA